MSTPVPNAPDAASAPPPELTRSPLADGEWHRLHPLTPLLRGGLFLLVIIGILVANLRERLIFLFVPSLAPGFDLDEELADDEWSSGDPVDWVISNNLSIIAILVVLAALLVITAWFYVSWRFHTFRITGDNVEVRSGILFRTQRRAPLDRVQGVNMIRPLVARLLGMAKLEVAGAGADSNVKLEYLSTVNAEEVRADILRLASGRRLAAAGVPARPGVPAGQGFGATVSRGITGVLEGEDLTAPEPESVVHIPFGRIAAAHALGGSAVTFVVLLVAVIVIAATNAIPALLFSIIPILIGVGGFWIRSVVRSLRYAIAPTPDGVRITFGLFTTITEIVPPGRVHALQISQPLLWRPFGWWQISINRLTGRSATEDASMQALFSTILPVGTLTDVERVLGLMLPDLSAQDRAELVRGMIGTGTELGYTTSPTRAWPFAPLSFRRNGFRLLSGLLLMRRGMIWRSLSVIPVVREQSFGMTQGPLQRWLRLAGVRSHVVTGPVTLTLGGLDRDDAVRLFDEVAREAIAAAARDSSHRWGAAAESWAAQAAAQTEAVAGAEPEMTPDAAITVSPEAPPLVSPEAPPLVSPVAPEPRGPLVPPPTPPAGSGS